VTAELTTDAFPRAAAHLVKTFVALGQNGELACASTVGASR
jgi:hypothetical protein